MQLTAFFMTNCRLLKDVPSFNVVGEIRGSQLPEEILTVGGHLDSWDLGEGAQDDGAGCMQSIEVIRAIKALGIQPKRTIRAVMFMNEENGGMGGGAYLKWANDKNEKHVFALESDAGGFTPRGISMDMNVEKRAKLIQWKPLFYEYGIYDFAPGGGGADIGPLKELGTPLAGFAPDSQRYFDLHHGANDVFEAVSKRELDLGAANACAALAVPLVSAGVHAKQGQVIALHGPGTGHKLTRKDLFSGRPGGEQDGCDMRNVPLELLDDVARRAVSLSRSLLLGEPVVNGRIEILDKDRWTIIDPPVMA